MNLHKLIFKFSVQQLGNQRTKFQHKICFKSDLNHLKLKSTPASAVTSRLFRDGNFLRIYKKLQTSFFSLLLKTVKSLPHNNEFKNLFLYESFRDLNRVLF